MLAAGVLEDDVEDVLDELLLDELEEESLAEEDVVDVVLLLESRESVR